ncbi:MAG: alpha/beta fold hydrolase [Hansschlegelia sp.]
MIADHSILFEGDTRVGVLLIHGLGGTPVEMKSLGRQLFDAGATVYCCQLAGHCGTEDDLRATDRRDWLDSARAALAVLNARCDKVVVGGLSLGACLAAMLAAEEPARVDGVIMLAPTLKYDGWSIPWYSFLLKLLIDTPFGRRWRFVEQEPYGVKDERTRLLIIRALKSDDSSTAGLLGTPSQALREMWRVVDELRSEAARVKQPTLIVHAREDDVASLGNAFWLQKHLGGLVETLVLDDSYHLVTVDRQRKLVATRAARFMQEIAASGASRPDQTRSAA